MGLRIVLLGTRGIPARYGGFETFAEELSTRLVERGHKVTVYGRRRFGEKTSEESPYRGVSRRVVPTVMHKYLETPLHALMSFLDLFFHQHDVALLCNAANSPFAWLIRLRGLPLAINVDGIERERSKWNSLGKLWYKLGERTSVWFASRIVADAQVIARYYKECFGADSSVIAYGATPVHRPPGKVLEQFSLTSGKYLLYVSRFEPENNALGVIEAYGAIPKERRTMPLVMVGDAPYADEYKRRLREAACEGVIFTGFQFGEAYQELRSHCYLTIQATEVGGTHPALVEAMAYGNAVIANDVPEHREVVGEAGCYYAKNDFKMLSSLLQEMLGDSQKVSQMGQQAKARAQELFSWDAITDSYEALLTSLAKNRG